MNDILKNKYKSVAIKALKEFDVDYDKLEFLTEETNVFFEVSGKDHVVLKIFQEESSKIEDNLIEAFMLEEVTKRTNIVVPTMLFSKLGKQVVFIESDEFDMVKRVAVYKYIEGEDFDGKETPLLFERLGEVTATIHNASKSIVIPDNLIPKKWDKVFYYRDEVAEYNEKRHDKYFTQEDRVFLDWFIRYLDSELPKYYNQESFLIHADLNPWNVKLYDGDIRLLDFEEGMLGSAVHDIAIMLFYYRYDPNYKYDEVKRSYLRGYSNVSTLPDFTDFDIDLLIMARTANFINYILLIINKK